MLEKDGVNFYLLNKSHLLPASRLDSVVDVCRDLVAMDSNHLEDSYFSIFLRVKNFHMAGMEKALYRSGSIARVKGLKNYTQIVPRELLAAIYTITKAERESAVESSLKSWGIAGESYEKLERAIVDSLNGKEKTLSQLKNGLAPVSRGVERGKGKRKERAMDVSIVAGAMLDRWMLLRGGIGRSPGESPNRFSLFRDRFKGLNLNMSRETALDMLAKRYVANYGPVSVEDLAWWLGVPQREAASAIRDLEGLKTTEITGIPGELYMFEDALAQVASVKSEPSVVFLPKDDPYVKAYRNTARFAPQDFNVMTKFGESASVVLIDGVVAGTWAIVKEKLTEACVVRLFAARPGVTDLEDRLRSAAAEAGRFYSGTEIHIDIKGL